MTIPWRGRHVARVLFLLTPHIEHSREHSLEHPQFPWALSGALLEHPDFPEQSGEHFRQHFQGFPTLAPLCDWRMGLQLQSPNSNIIKLRDAKPGGFQTRVFPTDLSGKVQIVSRTLSGLFLVGALNRPRKRKRANRENPRTIPEQIGKIPEKSGKSEKGQKGKDKSRSGNPPVWNTPV